MFLTIADVLSAEDVVRVCEKAADLTWADGARTAGGRARKVKQNEQADLNTEAGAGLHDFLLEAVQTHPVVKAAAHPRSFSRLLLSKTSEGGGYGAHVDNALMGGLRTDLSFTLFLSEPDTYEGGELVIDLPGGQQSAKPAAGDLVLYPSGSIHRVAPVTSGERLACVGWIESQVQDAMAREALFDLENVRVSLGQSLPEEAPEHLALDKVMSNLLRLWAQA